MAYERAETAKLHWAPKQNWFFAEATVSGMVINMNFVVRDTNRFADSGGEGYRILDFDTAFGSFKARTSARTVPRGSSVALESASMSSSNWFSLFVVALSEM